MKESTQLVIFYADMIVNFGLLIGVAWSIAFPDRRAWPPPQTQSWQYYATWVFFYIAFTANALLVQLDWNSWIIPDEIRYFIGIPLIVAGLILISWGIVTVGVKNLRSQRWFGFLWPL